MCVSPQLQWRAFTDFDISPTPENVLLCLLHLVRIDFCGTEYIDVLKSITVKLHRIPFSVRDFVLKNQQTHYSILFMI